jgi:adenosylmethionine---8-amino-7-oxononanoate aminotransferase
VQDPSTKAPFPLAARIGHKVAMEARQRGLLLRPIGNVLILVPPLSTSLPELKHMVEILKEAIEAVTQAT